MSWLVRAPACAGGIAARAGRLRCRRRREVPLTGGWNLVNLPGLPEAVKRDASAYQSVSYLLLADDNEGMRLMLRDLFRASGHDVALAADGPEVLASIQ